MFLRSNVAMLSGLWSVEALARGWLTSTAVPGFLGCFLANWVLPAHDVFFSDSGAYMSVFCYSSACLDAARAPNHSPQPRPPNRRHAYRFRLRGGGGGVVISSVSTVEQARDGLLVQYGNSLAEVTGD